MIASTQRLRRADPSLSFYLALSFRFRSLFPSVSLSRSIARTLSHSLCHTLPLAASFCVCLSPPLLFFLILYSIERDAWHASCFIYLHTHVCMCVWEYMQCINMCIYIMHKYVYIYMYINVDMYICACVCKYRYTSMYIFINIIFSLERDAIQRLWRFPLAPPPPMFTKHLTFIFLGVSWYKFE